MVDLLRKRGAVAALLLVVGCTSIQPMPPLPERGIFESPRSQAATQPCAPWQSAVNGACVDAMPTIGDFYPPTAVALFRAGQTQLEWVRIGSRGVDTDAVYNSLLWPGAGYSVYRGAFGSGDAMRRELLRLGVVAAAAFGILSNRTPGIEGMYFDAAHQLSCESLLATRYLYRTREVTGLVIPQRCDLETCGWSTDNMPSIGATTAELRQVLAALHTARRSLVAELEARSPRAANVETDPVRARLKEVNGSGGSGKAASVGNPVRDIETLLDKRELEAQTKLDAVGAIRSGIEGAGPRLERRTIAIDLQFRSAIREKSPQLAQLQDRIEQLAGSVKDLAARTTQPASSGKAQGDAVETKDASLASLRRRLTDASWRRWQDFDAWHGARLDNALSKADLWISEDKLRKEMLDDELKRSKCSAKPDTPTATAPAQPTSTPTTLQRTETPATPNTRDLPKRAS